MTLSGVAFNRADFNRAAVRRATGFSVTCVALIRPIVLPARRAGRDVPRVAHGNER